MILQDLFEMPISGIHTYGDMTATDWAAGSLRPEDRGIVSSPKGHEKIKRVLQKAPVPIELHFVNLPHYIEDITLHTRNNRDTGFFDPEYIKQRYDIDINFNPDAFNLMYVQNEGTERVPLTPWIIAHRLSHAFDRGQEPGDEHWTEVFRMFYGYMRQISELYINGEREEYIWTAMANALGTTKASRDGKITRFGEWFHECFAQFCVTGHVSFNPAPNMLSYQNEIWWFHLRERPTVYLPFIDRLLKDVAVKLEIAFTKELQDAIGKILVF